MYRFKTVPEFIMCLSEKRKAEVEALRDIILTAHPSLVEHIKWNAPSYQFNGIDRITFNLHDEDIIRLVLHCDTARKEDKNAEPIFEDATGLLVWNSNIRATISFSDLSDVNNKKEKLAAVLKQWLTI